MAGLAANLAKGDAAGPYGRNPRRDRRRGEKQEKARHRVDPRSVVLRIGCRVAEDHAALRRDVGREVGARHAELVQVRRRGELSERHHLRFPAEPADASVHEVRTTDDTVRARHGPRQVKNGAIRDRIDQTQPEQRRRVPFRDDRRVGRHRLPRNRARVGHDALLLDHRPALVRHRVEAAGSVAPEPRDGHRARSPARRACVTRRAAGGVEDRPEAARRRLHRLELRPACREELRQERWQPVRSGPHDVRRAGPRAGHENRGERDASGGRHERLPSPFIDNVNTKDWVRRMQSTSPARYLLGVR